MPLPVCSSPTVPVVPVSRLLSGSVEGCVVGAGVVPGLG